MRCTLSGLRKAFEEEPWTGVDQPSFENPISGNDSMASYLSSSCRLTSELRKASEEGSPGQERAEGREKIEETCELLRR
jgi:hypothetical protein